MASDDDVTRLAASEIRCTGVMDPRVRTDARFARQNPPKNAENRRDIRALRGAGGAAPYRFFATGAEGSCTLQVDDASVVCA